MSLFKVLTTDVSQPSRTSYDISNFGEEYIPLVSDFKSKDLGTSFPINTSGASNISSASRVENAKFNTNKFERVIDALNAKAFGAENQISVSEIIKTQEIECLLNFDYTPEIGKSITQILEAKQLESIIDDKIQLQLIKIIESNPSSKTAWRKAKEKVENEISKCLSIYEGLEAYSNIIEQFKDSISIKKQDSNIGSKLIQDLGRLGSKNYFKFQSSRKIIEIASDLTSCSKFEIENNFDLYKFFWLALSDINSTLEWGISPGYLINQNNRNSAVDVDSKIKSFNPSIKKLSEINKNNSDLILEINNFEQIAYYSTIITNELKYSLGAFNLRQDLDYTTSNINFGSSTIANAANSVRSATFNSFLDTANDGPLPSTVGESSNLKINIFKAPKKFNSVDFDKNSIFNNFFDLEEKIAFFSDHSIPANLELENFKFSTKEISDNFLTSIQNGFYENFVNSIENNRKVFNKTEDYIKKLCLNDLINESSILNSNVLMARILKDFNSFISDFSTGKNDYSSVSNRKIFEFIVFNKIKPSGLTKHEEIRARRQGQDVNGNSIIPDTTVVEPEVVIPKDIFYSFFYTQIYNNMPNYTNSIFRNVQFEKKLNSNGSYSVGVDSNDFFKIKNEHLNQVNDYIFQKTSKNSVIDNYQAPIDARVSARRSPFGFIDRILDGDFLVQNFLLSELELPKIISNILIEIEKEFKRIYVSIENKNFRTNYKSPYSLINYTTFVEILINIFHFLFKNSAEADHWSVKMIKYKSTSTEGIFGTGIGATDSTTTTLYFYDQLQVNLINKNHILFLDQLSEKLKNVKLNEFIIDLRNRLSLNNVDKLAANEALFNTNINYRDFLEISKKLIIEKDSIKNLFAISNAAFKNFFLSLAKLRLWYGFLNFSTRNKNTPPELNSLIEFLDNGNINLLNGLSPKKKLMFHYKINKLKRSRNKNYDLTYDSYEIYELLKHYNNSLVGRNKNYKLIITSLNKGTISENYKKLNKNDGNLNLKFKVSKIDNLIPSNQFKDLVVANINGCLDLDDQNFIDALSASIEKKSKIDLSALSDEFKSNYSFYNTILDEPILLDDKNSTQLMNLLESQTIRMLVQKVFDLELNPSEMNDIIIDFDSTDMSNIIEPISKKFDIPNLNEMLFESSQNNKLKLKNRSKLNQYLLDNFKKVNNNGIVFYDLKDDIFQIVDSLYTLLDSFIFKSSSIQNYVFFDDNDYYDGVWGLKIEPSNFVPVSNADLNFKSSVNLDSYYISCEFS